MAKNEVSKRRAGQVTNEKKWLVLTESTRKAGVGFTHKCGAEILGQDVLLTVRDGVFPLSGSGEVRHETVPYCPKCEQRPASSGIILPSGSMSVGL